MNEIINPGSPQEVLDKAKYHWHEMQKGNDLIEKGKGLVVEHAWHLGGILLEEKTKLRHGQWLPWLKDNLPEIPERVAQRCTKLRREHPNLAELKSAGWADLTARRFLEDASMAVQEKQVKELKGLSNTSPHERHPRGS